MSTSLKLTRTQWLICTIAAIGFAFDIYELLMLPLIIKPAIAALSAPLIEELVKGGMAPADAAALWTPGGKMYVQWARTLFFVPAIAGGVFGLLGGYLTDRLGRRRVGARRGPRGAAAGGPAGGGAIAGLPAAGQRDATGQLHATGCQEQSAGQCEGRLHTRTYSNLCASVTA